VTGIGHQAQAETGSVFFPLRGSGFRGWPTPGSGSRCGRVHPKTTFDILAVQQRTPPGPVLIW
jgi:hypothetical protein